MQNQKKSRKSLIIGIIAAVVILAVLLALLLTQCTGLGGNATEPVETTEPTAAVTYELYWNLDRELYDGKSEAGMSSRQPEEDGLFHIRFQLDGKEVTLCTADRKVINKIDSMDLMGLVFDEDGLIIDAIDPEKMPLELVGYMFYVQSVGGKAIKLNSSDIFSGIEVMLERTENTGIWDMTGISGPEGIAADPIIYDRVIAVQNLEGELTHVFIVDRSNYFLTHEAECQHCEQTVTWYEWTKEGELPKRSGHYQLMNDVQLTAQHSMAENVKLCLDLNGYAVHGATDDRVFSLAKSGTELALMDTSEAQTGKIAGHGATPQGGVLWVRNGNYYMYSGTLDGSDVIGTNGVTVMVDASHFFYFHGGTILGGTAQAQALATTSSGWGYGAGGAVYIRGTMRMYGGTIKGGRATEGYYWKNGKQVAARGIGGNIFMNTGSVLEIQGGEILGGYAGNAGGNIYADGTAELIISGGTISGGSSNSKTTSGHGGNIYTGSKTIVTMSGGTVCGGWTSKNNAGGNMAINGVMNMQGGSIFGGRASNGGNVHVGGNGKFNMYGGAVYGGYAEKYGGNMNVSGTSVLTVYGGLIQNGTADSSGGNLNCNVNGTINIAGGSLSGGIAKGKAAGSGGGSISLITDGAKVNISGGVITGGSAEGDVKEDGSTAGGDGGNINMNRGTMTVSGGVITAGKATGNAGGIYVGSNSKGLTLSGSALIYGNGTDIVRSAATAEGKSDIIVNGWKGNGDKGRLVIDRLKGVAGSVIAIPMQGKTLTDAELELFTSARKFLPLAINSEGQLAFADKVDLGQADHTHCLCGGTYKGHTCADTGFVGVDAATFATCWTLKDGAKHLLGNMSLCLTEDIELSVAHFTAGYELNLCLNGHTVTVKDEGRLTSNGTTGVLNITDCTGKGLIQADASRKGSLMTTYKGELNIYGGTIDASAIKLGTTDTTKVGTVVYVRESADRLALYGGKIIGGEAYRGGAVYVEKGSFTMYGGEITGGTASIGGNVATSLGSFEMLGGKIYGGAATVNGDGVHIGNSAPDTLVLSGSAMIYGNGTEDVYLGQQVSKKLNYLILDGWNGNGENGALALNCRGAVNGSAVAQAKEGALTADDLAKLSYADSAYGLKLKDGKVILRSKFDHEHCLCNGTLTGTNGHTCDTVGFVSVKTAEEFEALFNKDNALRAPADIVLTGDFALDAAYFTKGKVLNLCLNGHTITMTGDARLTASSNGDLNITDCTGKGAIKAAADIKQSMLSTYNASLKLYSGVLDASAVDSTKISGGAVILRNTDDVFTMYGGQIIGGKVDRGGAVYVEIGSFRMHGGTITGGQATIGGAVSVNKGTMEMTGGTITGCSATSTGGGVNIQANATSFTLSGDAKIYGNTADGKPQDVYMGKKGLCLTLDGWTGNSENGALVLSCREATAGSAVAQAKEGALTADDLGKLKYMSAAFELVLKDGKAVLAVAQVTTTDHAHCLCNGAMEAGCDHDSKVMFAEVSDAATFVSLLMAEGTDSVNICLGDSFELTGTQKIQGKTVNLCLNGKTLTMNGAKIAAQNGATLNITTCSGGKIKAGNASSNQMLLAHDGVGYINLYDGIIDASAVSTIGNAAAVLVRNNTADTGTSTFTMYGGQIIGGKAGRGGAIYVEKGRFNMHGGEITGGEATLGGAVSVNQGVMEMTGGTITDCLATGADATGGGVNIQNGAARFTISGTAKIYGNTCNGQPEDVYIGNKANTAYYLTVNQWQGNGENGALVLNHREPAVGRVVAQAKEGALTADDLAKLSYADSAYVLALEDGKAVLADPPVDHEHCLCNGALIHTCEELVFTEIATADAFKALFDEDNKLKADSHIVLTGSFELEEQYFSNGYVWSLCLNGQTLTLKGEGRLTANGSGELNITDCDGEGKLLAAEGCRESLITTNNGTLNLYSGIINATAVDSNGYGGAVNLLKDGDVFTMYGGAIHGGKVDRGGAVYSTSVAQFHMHGGQITGGRATLGGAVSMNKGTMEMTGGTITGCSATSTGGGVNIQANAAGFILSGTAKIYGNTSNGKPQDVYMGKKGLCLTLDGWTGNGESGTLALYCREATVGSAVAQAKEGQLTADDLNKLKYADSAFTLELKEGKAVLAAVPTAHEHCLCNDGTLANGCTNHEKYIFTEVSDAAAFAALIENGTSPVNICLSGSFTLEDTCYIKGGKTVNLCLGNEILTVTGDVQVQKDSTLNITACGAKGKIQAGTDADMVLYANNGAINLYRGTLDFTAVNGSTSGYTPIKLDDGENKTDYLSTFTMYGGDIIGATMAYRGGAIYASYGNVYMYGGTITGGTATLGGAVSINKGVMVMSGGTISGCAATGTSATGGGVNIQANATSFTLSGDAKIYGNTVNDEAQDVYMGKTNLSLVLDDWNGNGSNAKLVLSCKGAVENSTVATAPAGKTLTDADAAKLSYDSDELGVVQKDGVLILSQSHVHCACGGSMDGHGHVNVTYSTKVSSADEFKALFDNDGKLKANTDVVLTGSFELNSQYFTSGYTLNLCLNGNTVTLKDSGRLTADGETGTLVITTCKDGGKITAAEGCADNFLYTDGGHINMYGGEVKAQGQRAVSLNGTDSTFDLYGGTITGGTEAFGGNILVNDGTTLTMYGGNVLGGTSTRTAGDKGGGNIHVENGGTFDMQGGTVSGGHCDGRFGGNVCVLGYMKMSGGTITKGSAKYGGNVALSHATNQAGKLDMSGGQITEGTCVTSGDGVYARSNSGALTLSADAKIYGNGTVDVYLDKKDKCLVLDSWNSNGTNDALVLGCKEAAENSIVAKAPDGKTLVEADVAKLVYNSEDLAVKLSDEGNIILYTLHRHCLCVDGKLASGCTMDHSKLTFTPVASFDELKAAVAEQSPVNIYLTASFELTEDISIGDKVVNLCLNDQTLTCASSNVKRLKATSGGTLNITACNEAGKIVTEVSQALTLSGGNIALYQGAVDAKAVNGNANGGAVYVNADSSTFTLYGGTILGATKTYRGGGVYVNKGSFEMHGGMITEGHSTDGGAGVCVNTGHMKMTGGTITGCADSTTDPLKLGGGVCMLTNADSITLSGDAKIYGNTSGGVANDLYIGNKGKTAFYLILDGWNGNGKDENEEPRVLYFTTHKDKTAGSVVAQAKEGVLTADDVAKLACTGDTFALELNADGKIALKTK